MEGSPAEEAGLQRGDILVSIDGTSVEGYQLEDVSKNIRGPVDTSVDLVVRRDGEEKFLYRPAPTDPRADSRRQDGRRHGRRLYPCGRLQ